MKKLFSMLFIATMLGLVFTACGDDKDEPEAPKAQNLQSTHESENDTYFVFDIDLDKDSSTIYMYNIVFHIGEATSPAMTLRVDAPVTVDKSGKVYTYSGTGILAYMLRGTSWAPMPGDAYLVNNLTCNVNPEAKTYAITFDCHGGHFEESGKLQ